MVTDRFATAGLVLILANMYPAYMIAFLMLNVLDFCSHWMRMYSCLYRGETSHKNVDESQNVVLRIYYGNRTVLGLLCLGNEFFYWFLYLAHFHTGPIVFGSVGLVRLLIYVVSVPFALKQMTNFIQLWNSACEIVEFEYQTEHKHK